MTGESSRPTAPAGDAASGPVLQEIPDDRNTIVVDDNVLLIIEDDIRFSRILLDVANKTGFKVLLAQRGDAGIELARKFKPDAITLDIGLPDMDGWQVLDLLKHDPETRYIPVHVISDSPDVHRTFENGALSCIEKPAAPEMLLASLVTIREFIDRRTRNLLVVEDDDVQRAAMVELVGGDGVETTAVAGSDEALRKLSWKRFDCMVLNLDLPNLAAFKLLQVIGAQESLKTLPIIVHTKRDLNSREEAQLKNLSKSAVIKAARSPEALVSETSLYLHRPDSSFSPYQRRLMGTPDPKLANKTVLIVDDDVRNIFALTSLLEQHRIKSRHAESGSAAIQILESSSEMHIILMDVMMPDMDGFETIRAIRRNPRFASLPIVALTAKAMKGDREKCLAAGASDYIAKPVDIQRLMSILRVWTLA